MDSLKMGEIAVLEDGKEYIVFSQINYEGNNYVYLVSNFKPVEVRFAKQMRNGNDLVLAIVNKPEEKQKLLTLLQQKNQNN